MKKLGDFRETSEKKLQAAAVLEQLYNIKDVAGKLLEKYKGDIKVYNHLELANLISLSLQFQENYKVFENLDKKLFESEKNAKEMYKIVRNGMKGTKKPLEDAIKKLRSYIRKNPKEADKILEAYGEAIKAQQKEPAERIEGLNRSYKLVENFVKSSYSK